MLCMSSGRFMRRVTDAFIESVAPPPMNVLDRVLLYAFDTGRSQILPAHRDALRQFVLPWLETDGPALSVWIGGLWALQLGVTLGSDTHFSLRPNNAQTSVQIDPFESRSYGFAASFGLIGGPFEYCGPA